MNYLSLKRVVEEKTLRQPFFLNTLKSRPLDLGCLGDNRPLICLKHQNNNTLEKGRPAFFRW